MIEKAIFGSLSVNQLEQGVSPGKNITEKPDAYPLQLTLARSLDNLLEQQVFSFSKMTKETH